MSDEQLNALRLLANDVRNTLAEAGLPITGELEPGLRVGVRVEVDPADDDAGGVWVDWHAHPSLVSAIMQSVQEQRLDDPVLARHGAVAEAMQAAMLAILTANGFTAHDPDHEYRPYELKVTAGPGHGTGWQSWLTGP